MLTVTTVLALSSVLMTWTIQREQVLWSGGGSLNRVTQPSFRAGGAEVLPLSLSVFSNVASFIVGIISDRRKTVSMTERQRGWIDSVFFLDPEEHVTDASYRRKFSSSRLGELLAFSLGVLIGKQSIMLLIFQACRTEWSNAYKVESTVPRMKRAGSVWWLLLLQLLWDPL